MTTTMKAIALIAIFITLVHRGHSSPCTNFTERWSADNGIICHGSSIENNKLLVPELDIRTLSIIRFAENSNVTSVPASVFSRFTTIKKLELGHCHINEIQQKSFTGLENLEYLNLVENELHSIPPLAFETLSKLMKLDLGHNNISQFSSDSFKGLISLAVMYLRNNQIKNIPQGAFVDLAKLDGFYIDYNELEELGPEFLGRSSKVREIDLSHNKLTKLDPAAFKGLIGLKHLYLNHNNLKTLPAKVFSELGSLERLRLWHNSLTDFEIGTFDGLHELRILELERNKIKVIHENTFQGLVHLQRLELHDNEITSLDITSMLNQFKSLDTIKIHNNLWNCHALKNITEALEDRSVSFDGGNSYSGANVNGIKCTNDKAFHITAEDIKATLVDLKLNDYINNEFQNSSLYNFFNGEYLSSKFSDFMENGFKNTNLYKFFNGDFMNSPLYKFFSEHQSGPKAAAYNSSPENQNSDSIYLTFISVGLIVFLVGIIFLVVGYRLVRKRRSEDKLTLVEPNRDNHELGSIQVA